MGETMTLWQRCEALGPQSVDGIEIEKNGECWIIVLDGYALHYIHEGKIPNRAWLCDAILQRFEAINRPMVYSFSGGPKEWNEFKNEQHKDELFSCAHGGVSIGSFCPKCETVVGMPCDPSDAMIIPAKLNDQVAYFAESPTCTGVVRDIRNICQEQLEANVALLMEEYNAKRLNLQESKISMP
jgi:hypothetical protein